VPSTSSVTDDCEEVDEISRTWRHDRVAIADYFDEVLSASSDVHPDVRDVATREWTDTGVVACVIVQTCRYQGRVSGSPRRPRSCSAANAAIGGSP
jgi:hypothetical protein